MAILNPYAKNGTWLRGSFHIHTNISNCGWHSLDEILLAYKDYDFLAITDHDQLNEIQGNFGDKTIFKGLEVSSPTSHMLLVNPPKTILNNYSNLFSVENYQKLATECIADGGIAILNHPNRFNAIHWQIDQILMLTDYTGIEIYSGDGIVYEEDVAFDVWDKLLSVGKKAWGFGNDDFHHWGQEKRVWNMVLAEANTVEAIIRAVKEGSFYVSTGFGFEEVTVARDKVRIILKHNGVLERMYKYVTFFGKDGRKLHEVTGRIREAEYTCQGDEGYVRVAAYLEGGYGAFSQPLSVTG